MGMTDTTGSTGRGNVHGIPLLNCAMPTATWARSPASVKLLSNRRFPCSHSSPPAFSPPPWPKRPPKATASPLELSWSSLSGVTFSYPTTPTSTDSDEAWSRKTRLVRLTRFRDNVLPVIILGTDASLRDPDSGSFDLNR